MSTSTMLSTPTAKNSSKSTKLSKTVILRLGSELLRQFPSDSEIKPSQAPDTPTVIAPESESADKESESNSTSLPPGTPSATDDASVAPSADGIKKKGTPGQKAGVKRSISDADALAKLKGRPGPKKKPRLADGSIDRTNDSTKKGTPVAAAPAGVHKLGPKANTGAINAGLRALDRSGKPCRRWGRKGFQLKSFTGFAWDAGSWVAPQRDSSAFSGDVKSDSSSTGDNKPVVDSSAVPSERSNSDAAALQPNGVESSPAPVAA